MKIRVSRELQADYWESFQRRRAADHPVVKAFAEPKLRCIKQHVPAASRSMLEIGAGNGFFSETFREEFEITCLDFSRNMLQRNPLPASSKVVGHAECLPFPDSSFDVVFCGNLLHHLERPIDAVREMARVSRGHVVLIERNALNPMMAAFGWVKPEERGTLKFVPKYLRALGLGAGMALTHFEAQGMVLPNKTPRWALPFAVAVDRPHPLAFYLVAVFRVSEPAQPPS